MNKLYGLWKTHPAVLYHYLTHMIFPKHMRSQRVKISACGQALGGDMLFGRRVGFSGTPSDLLPKEMGQCDYERGDDGKMMSTILNSTVFDVKHFEGEWTIEGLLDTVANSRDPEFHALIDTGALITGYSNEEVAKQLLKRGLKGFDGVVFLDDEDKKKVLVRATGRIVNQDQCGIPLTRRFAFYDQIHTTGMDIKHRVNARAALTLGKDMVFRDYVQGAYRMRGIGACVGACARVCGRACVTLLCIVLFVWVCVRACVAWVRACACVRALLCCVLYCVFGCAWRGCVAWVRGVAWRAPFCSCCQCEP
jgi:hypothetical protein